MSLSVNVSLPSTITDPSDDLWEHCRNGLGIARLLVHEKRPEHLVATACRMAVESACRLTCERVGRRWDGDVRTALDLLSAPDPLRIEETGLRPGERLALAERRVTWLASVLRSQAPERCWKL
jgi:hypothetical protein